MVSVRKDTGAGRKRKRNEFRFSDDENRKKAARMFGLIRLSLWGEGNAAADPELFREMKQQAIAALPASCLSSLAMSPKLRQEWKRLIIQHMTIYTQYCYVQDNLPVRVPYAVLKGTAAAQYYPYPEYRSMGDIDIIVRREDYDTACREMLDEGYQLIEDNGRHISLEKNGVIVEIHQSFGYFSEISKTKYLDELIFAHMTEDHILPDPVNGMVLLEHINQHLEAGLGLRQIIDWMMFVDKCLPDEKWPEFQKMAGRVGLEKLAIVSARMCELYLGLPEHRWCEEADPKLCRDLMEYISSCGNFGLKKQKDTRASETTFSYTERPWLIFKHLQKRGLDHWEAARKYIFLRPFAWVYQICRYISKFIKRNNTVSRLKTEYAAAMRKNHLLKELGVRRASMGTVVFKNGEYRKEYKTV